MLTMSNIEAMAAADLTLAHLRTLAEIARRSSFSRAAEALGLSQPAVSLHVRHLERALATPLLERVGKRAVPTEAGRLLLEHAGRAAAELDAAVQALARRRGVVAGRVRLGAGATASIHLLPPLFRRLRARHPGLELQVVTGNTPDIVARLLANELDLAVVTNPTASRRLAMAPLGTDPLVAVAPGGVEWRRRRPFTPADLGRHPLILYERGGAIRGVIDAWFRRAGVAPRVAMELGSAEAIKKLVEAGLGLSISPAVAVRAEVRAGALRAIALDPPLARRLGVVWRRDKPDTPALAVVRRGLAELGAGRAGPPRRPPAPEGPPVPPARPAAERGARRGQPPSPAVHPSRPRR